MVILDDIRERADPASGADAGAGANAGGTRRRHIVDELIAERAPRLTRNPLWPLIRPALYAMLDYGKARRMADAIAPMSGEQALLYCSELLQLEVMALLLERVPASGRCVVVCNHPTGIADGLAVFDALRRVRSDAIFFANADALRVSPRLAETVIPVEWVETKRTREKTRATLDAARRAFEAERAVVLFPAGRLARVQGDGQLTDPPWASTAVTLARKYQAPIVPIHVSGPYFTCSTASRRSCATSRCFTSCSTSAASAFA
jgi:putative hemolysin